jgi:hypothetical protein
MLKKSLIIIVLLNLMLISLKAQVSREDEELKREITLYNPYKPSLPAVRKRSFLPNMNDTAKVNLVINYDIRPSKFAPVYTIRPIRSAALLPDPLPKLYKSYVKIGLGNFFTPLAEISITNERSKKGAAGFYGRHYSSNGKILLQNKERIFAGIMDNEASLFGKKFFRRSVIGGSVNFLQNTRYAYGYKPEITDYDPSKKDIKLVYNNIGVKSSFASLNLDSSDLSYDFELFYNFFQNSTSLFQNHAGFSGTMATIFGGLYLGSGLDFDYYKLSDSIMTEPKYIFSLNPFIKKSTEQYNITLGVLATVEKNLTVSPRLHIYPDINFGFSVVPEYITFYTALSGKLEKNEPERAIIQNPFIMPDGSLFTLPNTDHSLVVSAGLRGNNGLGGNYHLSVSYSLINDLILYSNIVFPDTASRVERGNYFIPLEDDAELLNIHGEINGVIGDKLTYNASGNYYSYTLSANEYPWNKPSWDGRVAVNYNLRNKIIAGIEVTALGKSKFMVSESPTGWLTLSPTVIEKSPHFNLNINAEYRYTRILSFWIKFSNISTKRYYEWAFYPSHRYLFMAGFTYSL